MTSALNPRFSFETFVVGSANRLAVTAGRTVAENPGSAYNPLFIYSGSGLGKTHVMMAIGHAAKTIASQLNIEYLTLDEYVEAFHAAIAAGQGDAFRRRFQNVDVLLVDDVQFLTNRKEMQAELLRLTEALQQSGHQIVLASDRPPAEIADLDERLISRFSGGLVVDIGIPDYETRVAILRRKAEERGSKFQPGVLETVERGDGTAEHVATPGRIDDLIEGRRMHRGRGNQLGANRIAGEVRGAPFASVTHNVLQPCRSASAAIASASGPSWPISSSLSCTTLKQPNHAGAWGRGLGTRVPSGSFARKRL